MVLQLTAVGMPWNDCQFITFTGRRLHSKPAMNQWLIHHANVLVHPAGWTSDSVPSDVSHLEKESIPIPGCPIQKSKINPISKFKSEKTSSKLLNYCSISLVGYLETAWHKSRQPVQRPRCPTPPHTTAWTGACCGRNDPTTEGLILGYEKISCEIVGYIYP